MKSQQILIKNGTLVTMNNTFDILKGDLLIENNIIKKISKNIPEPVNCQIIDASNQFVIPGLIQSHVHLCQTLYRGFADDLPLLDWLKNKIWPMEHNHTENSIQASADLSLLEMNLLGTTSILDMASVRNTNALLEAVERSGMRYWGGKCFMDYKDYSGPLYESTSDTLKETEELIKLWHKKNDLMNYALCPRFVISCTEEILIESREMQKQFNLIIHTHASENKDEVDLVLKRTGLRNITYLDKIKLLNKQSAIAHCIHLDEHEISLMKKSQANILHCPSSNLKLASGIAQIERYINEGISVSIGADGAPCNNNLDPFMEMRLCALLQKPLFGSEALSAQKALEIGTLGGARALGMENQLGRLSEGYLADVVTIDRSHPSVCTIENPYSAIVYSCSGRDVSNTIVNGKLLVKNKVHQIFDEDSVKERAKLELGKMIQRINN